MVVFDSSRLEAALATMTPDPLEAIRPAWEQPTEAAIAAYEEEFGHSLPADFRWFQLHATPICPDGRQYYCYCSASGGDAGLNAMEPVRPKFMGRRTGLEWALNQGCREDFDRIHPSLFADGGLAEYESWNRKFLPIALGPGREWIGYDYGFDSENPPLISYDAEWGFAHPRGLGYVADSFTALLELPLEQPGEPFREGEPCTNSKRSKQWTAWKQDLFHRTILERYWTE